jgi:hypothetical protein
MLDFDVIIYPNHQDVLKESLEKVNQDLDELNFFDSNSLKNKIYKNLCDGNYKSALATIDGLKSNTEEELIKIQKKSMNLFSHDELRRIFNLIMNEAFLNNGMRTTPENSNDISAGFLSDFIPHRILYEELVNKPISLFSKVVNDQLKDLLFNGAFWETTMLTYDVNYKGTDKNSKFVEDILLKEFNKLDAGKSKQGIEKLLQMSQEIKVYINRKQKEWIRLGYDFNDMSPDAVRNYFAFVKEIYDKKVIENKPEEIIGYLLLPVLDYELNEGFCDADEDDSDLALGFSIFKDDFFRSIVKNSATMQQRLSDYLVNESVDDINQDIYSIVVNLPGSSDILMYAGETLVDMTRYGENRDDYYFNQRFALKNDEKTNSYKCVYYPSRMETFKEKLN